MTHAVSFHPDDRAYVFAIVLRIVRSPVDADDVTQDALLLAYRYRDGYRGDAAYHTWLYRIAVTAALRFVRRRRRSREELPPSGELDLIDEAASVLDELERADTRNLVRAAIDSLPPPYRDVLLGRARASEEQVARRLGLTVSNVKVRGHRARKHLREALAPLLAA